MSVNISKKNKVKIFRDTCPNLINEIKNYKRKPQLIGKEAVDERPIKLNDDCCDALRYLIMSRPQIAIKKKPRSVDSAIPLAGELIGSTADSDYQRWMR